MIQVVVSERDHEAKRGLIVSKSLELAEIAYSPEYRRIELTLPFGTKMADFARISEKVFSEVLTKLPRGCDTCFSGEDFGIKVRLENVLFFNMETMEVVVQR